MNFSALPRPLVTVQPLLHVADLAATISFYETFGAVLLHRHPDGDFALLSLGSTQLALLAHPPNPEQDSGAVELTFVAENLDEVARELGKAGVAVAGPVTSTVFGHQIQVTAPGGQLVKINEYAP